MPVFIPLVIQVQGNQIKIGLGGPTVNPKQSLNLKVPAAQPAAPANNPMSLRQMLMKPSLN